MINERKILEQKINLYHVIGSKIIFYVPSVKSYAEEYKGIEEVQN